MTDHSNTRLLRPPYAVAGVRNIEALCDVAGLAAVMPGPFDNNDAPRVMRTWQQPGRSVLPPAQSTFAPE